ncbi:MAG TPA: glycerol-3-phosphate dehydrogenase/oxidase [Solirubrobacterales bacterium]|nr:glycerol-3-phosphate dehydrogenase/oxidase [Solirubrobacterales bacterium]HMU26879.1 glycerol-3-phosphate dehydrogenase/oxidase [Solirubrobacterales bacterium]HMX71393.1 glycerol-3-phosphate dehydrogenase/oxidase [Solirubrobacterales bacterium]HMY26205.1 glycerol-3-phosphate dehydrogenase/oxidase [Solirubrobacterales bacterium]HNA24289.1 glycerol-3-phosphate dehydrogenase/oxidase [Solirubrobacterales bacterium]
MVGRSQSLEAIAGSHFEVVVIGGGITGAGVALDAASRGYSVALLEGRDYAIGTSSRSSKMVHGGLRYLENFDVGLVREALLERQLLVELAPHLVYPTPFLVPSFGEEKPDRKVGLGLGAYDVLAGATSGRNRRERRWRRRPAEAEESWSPDRHRTIDREELLELVPALETRDPESAYLFYDCQTDDARLVLTVLGEAERFGAVCLNGANVTRVLEKSGKARQVEFTEIASGETVVVEADNIVNATGVWADQIRPGEIEREEDIPKIAPSRGAHLLFSADDVDMGRAACIVPAGEGRRIFALPWYGRTLVGTTDVDHDGGIEEVAATEDDIEYLMNALNEFMDLSLTDSDIVGAFAGVRPLISTGDPRKSVDISRQAELYETSSGMLTITGGKLTTWRRMAKQTVDRIVERAGREARCQTAEIPLGMEIDPAELSAPEGVSKESLAQLAFRYGHAARGVIRIAESDPEMARPIVDGMPDLMAEARIAIEFEQARSLADVLLRRTRLGLTAASSLATADSVEPLAAVMAHGLGWGDIEKKRQIDEWLGTVKAEGLNPAGS